ncbi:hypothetical protein HSBAA_40060 [Vreelandella sulfidaeris]|uniref:DUF2797 domain-containing protein n=1 Tax=Vreelandella sulfidaeris TaxID=115553 RepID=A0A455U937_9GAMM|nr:hypothetical protein HSBAA_40060 [Halomonas sulfidaeris]
MPFAYWIVQRNIFTILSASSQKVVSHNFDKQPLVEGVLLGVKGQYLLLDSGVINLRKFTGYEVQVS